MPVASYSPELIEVFRKAAVEEVTLGPLPRGRAEALRFRLNNLRAAMRKEKHHDLSLAERVTIKLQDVDLQNALVICTPDPDRDFLEVLKAAGITLPDWREEEFQEERAQQDPEKVKSVLEQFRSKDGGDDE